MSGPKVGVWDFRYERPDRHGPASCAIGTGCCGLIALAMLFVPLLLAVIR